jgi:formylglycine-generating enzyme required for sulfatase activity
LRGEDKPVSEKGESRSAIEAIPFEPSKIERAIKRWSSGQIVLAASIAIVLFTLWFLFTAKSVRINFSAPTQAISLSGGFHIEFGNVFLLRRGEYEVVATSEGYETFSVKFEVNDERNQTLFFELTPTPGRLSIKVTPEDASFQVEGLQSWTQAVSGELVLRLPAGTHELMARHPRYQEARNTVEIDGRGQMQTIAIELVPNWSKIFIDSRPMGADIVIDGQATGVTTPQEVEVLAGEKQIELQLRGFKAHRRQIFSEPGRDQKLQIVALEKADAQLRVSSVPSGAFVSIDGNYIGATPLEVDLASLANQRLFVFARDHAPVQERLNLKKGSFNDRSIVLPRLTGNLRLETWPRDAQVSLNGKNLDSFSGQKDLVLPMDEYEIQIKKEGFADYRTNFSPMVEVDQTLQVKLLTLEEARIASLRPTIVTKVGQTLRLQNGSELMMGASRREPGRRANETLRKADFGRLFYLSEKEVTNAEFRAFASGHDSGKFDEISLNGDDQPATQISWNEAAAYCNWLSTQDKLEPFYNIEFSKVVGVNKEALGYRLPTEAEWAWAARTFPKEKSEANEQLQFPWGKSLPPPARFENYADRSAANKIGRVIYGYNDNFIASAPVGTYDSNQRGFYDLGGNVAEWVHDNYEIPSDEPVQDSLGPTKGEYRVIRGASWMHGTITELRLSFRDYGIAGRQDLGFRLARYAE